MKFSIIHRVVIAGMLVGFATGGQAAFPPSCEEALVLPVESIPEQAPGEEQWDRASFTVARDECQRLAAGARGRLASEFSIDTSGMSDLQVLYRLDEVVEGRERADAAAVIASEEEAQRQRDQVDRAGEAMAAGQLAAGAELLRQQNETLRSLGVDLGTLPGESSEDEEEETGEEGTFGLDDEKIDATELRMYQQMVQQGVAPQCRDHNGAALIDCVDRVLDEEDDEQDSR